MASSAYCLAVAASVLLFSNGRVHGLFDAHSLNDAGIARDLTAVLPGVPASPPHDALAGDYSKTVNALVADARQLECFRQSPWGH